MDRMVKRDWTLKDVLNLWGGEIGKKLVLALERMSEERQIDTVSCLLEAYLQELDDEHAPLMLEVLDRIVGKNNAITMCQRMEPLYWRLSQHMRRTRLWVIERLLEEWNCNITEGDSFYAFRRFIAMSFPQPIRQHRREGELDIEMKARGQEVDRAQQQGALEIMQERLSASTFVTDSFRQSHADDVFGPWLAQPWVPAEVYSLLVVARARCGGPAVVERDIRNAQILYGLPDSALSVIGSYTAGMRQIAKHAELVLDDIVRRTQERNPRYDAKANMKRHYEFKSTDCIEIGVRAHGDHDLAELHADSVLAIEEARKNGMLLSCVTTLTVYISPRDDDPGKTLTNYWQKAS